MKPLNKNSFFFSLASNKSSSFSHEINTLKKELEQEWKTNTYLLSTKELWPKQCARLKQKLENALFRAEKVSLPSKKTRSGSKFNNELVSLGTDSKGKQREQKELRANIAQNGLPLRLSYYAVCFEIYLQSLPSFCIGGPSHILALLCVPKSLRSK